MLYYQIIKDIFSDIFSVLGLSWLIIKFTTFFWGNSINWCKSNFTFVFIIILSVIYAMYKNWPYKKVRAKISGTDAYITLHYSDIFESKGSIVIASSNFFNTSLDIVNKRSLLGQCILKHFDGDNTKIEKDISSSLQNIKGEEVMISRGKNISYPIGSVAVFNIDNNKKVFLVAITRITEKNGNEKMESNISYVHQSLNNLWDKVEIKIDDQELNITPFGSGISRIFNRRTEAILYIIQSFIDRAKKKRPCSELIINIRKTDICLSDYLELRKIIKFLA